MSKTTVKVTMVAGWDKAIHAKLQIGLFEMTTDIHKRSTALAPRLTGALANSAVVGVIMNGYKVSFGSSRVPYARIRHYYNKKNPHTIGYLSKAADSVVRGNLAKYFSRKI